MSGLGLRALAATLGSVPVAVLASIALARWGTALGELRFSIALVGAIPLWLVLAVALAPLRRASDAWAVCAGASVALGAMVW